jgi:hypothetical protein
MQKTQLSTKGQIGLTLGVLLLFSLIFAFVGGKAFDQEREQMAGLAADGAVVTGKITDKYIHTVAKTWVYWLDIEFKTQSGAMQKGSKNVANTIYDSLKVGGPVQVTYVKSRPEWFFIPGTEPTERSIGQSDGMSRFGVIAAILFGTGLVILLLWPNNNGGTPASQSADRTVILPPPKEASLRPAPRQARTSFGTRQYRG